MQPASGMGSSSSTSSRVSSTVIQRRPAGRTDHVRFALLVTHDGGKTWSPATELQPLPGESAFAASNSAMATRGGWVWLGTSKARVLRTRDMLTWQSTQTPLASGNDSSGVFSVAFRDPMHGIAVGGDFRKPNDATNNTAFTSDGGEHWSAAGKPPHGYRSAVGVGCGGAGVDNGGQQWLRYLL